MNHVDAYNITRPASYPAIDRMSAEDAIFDALMDRWPNPRVMQLCEALGAGNYVFAKTNDLRAAIDAAVKVMETH